MKRHSLLKAGYCQSKTLRWKNQDKYGDEFS